MADFNSIHAKAYFNLIKTGGWIEERVKESLKPYNLTHAQLNILHILMENEPDPVSASFLKERMIVSNPDITRLIDRLVKKNLVCRSTCPENRRKIDIALTENRRKIDIALTDGGRELFKRVNMEGQHTMGNFFEDKISKEEAAELRRIMHKIRE